MRSRWVLAAVALLMVVGCSRQAATPQTSAAPATQYTNAGASNGSKAAFVDGANAACREYAKQDEALADPEALKDYVPFLKEFIKIGEELQTKLRALPVPPGDAKRIDGYLDGNDRQDALLRAALSKVEAAVRGSDLAGAEETLSDAIDQFNVISGSQDPFAKSYGLVDCANSGGGSSVAA